MNRQHALAMYSGYKFEELSTLPKTWDECTRYEIEHRSDNVVDNIQQYCSVVRTQLGSSTIIIGGEVDCLWGIHTIPQLLPEPLFLHEGIDKVNRLQARPTREPGLTLPRTQNISRTPHRPTNPNLRTPKAPQILGSIVSPRRPTNHRWLPLRNQCPRVHSDARDDAYPRAGAATRWRGDVGWECVY